jgi:hypothetical protein
VGSRHPLGNWYGAVAALLDDVHVRTTSRNRHAIRFDSQAYPALYILFLGWKSQFNCFGSGGGLYDDYLKKRTIPSGNGSLLTRARAMDAGMHPPCTVPKSFCIILDLIPCATMHRMI